MRDFKSSKREATEIYCATCSIGIVPATFASLTYVANCEATVANAIVFISFHVAPPFQAEFG